jgi:hypothetical protein
MTSTSYMLSFRVGPYICRERATKGTRDDFCKPECPEFQSELVNVVLSRADTQVSHETSPRLDTAEN